MKPRAETIAAALARNDWAICVPALQDLALQGLSIALGIDYSGAAAPIDPHEMQLLMAGFGSDEQGNASNKATAQRLSSAYLMTSAPEWSPYQVAQIDVALSPPKAPHGGLLTPALSTILPAIEVMAWVDIQFRRRVAQDLYMFLRRRVLLQATDLIAPELAAPTCWWLTYLGAKTRVSRSAKRDEAHFLAALLAHAKGQASNKAWAGFWDQLVFRLLNEQSQELPEPCRQLPLVSDGAAALSARKAEDIEQTIENWQDSAPGFAPSLVLGRL
jgi:hypothetical protein